MTHPYGRVAVAAAYNTRQARALEGATSVSVQVDAALGVLESVGLDRRSVDGVAGPAAASLVYELGIGPVWTSPGLLGIRSFLAAADAVALGHAETVLVVDGAAGVYTARQSTAPWTRPPNEFVVSAGMFTAVEFALIARTHMDRYGTTPEQLATVSAVIRNNGHDNPDAVYYGRGPFTAADVLASRMVADPFHLLDCSTTSEGGAALLVTTAQRARDLPFPPVAVLGAGLDQIGPAYQHPPGWDLVAPAGGGDPLGWVGRRAAARAFDMAGLRPPDVSVCELYDPFSFEIIRQLEAFGFCGEGEGGPFVEEGHIAQGGRLPVTTDGGCMAFNHSGTCQALQRVGRAVEQVQGRCRTHQVPGAEVALASNFGAGALFNDVVLLGPVGS